MIKRLQISYTLIVKRGSYEFYEEVKYEKVITAGLSFAMAASMLAGCSSKPAENSDSGDKRVLKFDSFSGGNGEKYLQN